MEEGPEEPPQLPSVSSTAGGVDDDMEVGEIRDHRYIFFEFFKNYFFVVIHLEEQFQWIIICISIFGIYKDFFLIQICCLKMIILQNWKMFVF